MPTSRQEDTGDLQVLLDRDLAQVLLDLQLAASTLCRLSHLDGPQPIEVSSGITIASRAIRSAQGALNVPHQVDDTGNRT